MLQGLQPDIVLIDARQATDFIVMYNQLKSKNIKVAVLQPMLPLHLTPGHPPMNSDVFPHGEEEVKKAIRKLKWNELKKTWKKKFIYLGFDDKFLIRRRIAKNAVPEHYISKSPSLLNFALQHIDEFILVPQAFDFPISEVSSTRHYIGFMPNEKRNDSSDPEYKKKEATIFSTKKNKNLKLLYCSFGTIALEEKEIVLLFLKKLIAVASIEDYLLVISLQAQPEDINKLQASENVYIFNSVPQLEVLSQADIFITHGGINSIKESIYAEVPMLMYPVHADFDPKGNAVRVAYHGLGLRGNIISDTEKEIQAHIKELLSNPLYKKSIQELKRKDSQYTLDQFLEKINSIKPLSLS
jgi:UDP:flavonoid glycosyltransferase YjiC (YdhE family)